MERSEMGSRVFSEGKKSTGARVSEWGVTGLGSRRVSVVYQRQKRLILSPNLSE